jgi:hypothetical protein
MIVVERPHPFGFKEDIIIFPNKIPSHFRTQNNKNSYFVKRCRYISQDMLYGVLDKVL